MSEHMDNFKKNLELRDELVELNWELKNLLSKRNASRLGITTTSGINHWVPKECLVSAINAMKQWSDKAIDEQNRVMKQVMEDAVQYKEGDE